MLLAASALRAAVWTEDRMAGIGAYLIDDRETEIALAVSAAPEPISSQATILVLGHDGYETARRGSNGFVCLVERAWAGQFFYVGAFWDPQVRSPICYNRHAADSVLPLYMMRTELALAGKGRADIANAIDAAVASGKARAPTGTAMSYMMSGGQYLHPDIGRWRPHLMIWIPYSDQADWGPNPVGGADPVVWRNRGGPFAMVVIPYGEERFIEPGRVARRSTDND